MFNKTLSMEAQLKKLIQSVDWQSKLQTGKNQGPAIVADKNIDILNQGEINHNESMHVRQI